MKNILKLIFLSFILSACTSAPTVKTDIKKNSGDIFAYAYMEKGDTLKSIASNNSSTKDNDEIILLAENKFLPDYSLLSVSCGIGGDKKIDVCLSKYSKKTKGSFGDAAVRTAIMAGLTSGLTLLSRRSYQKEVFATFSPEKLESIARKNNLVKYRKMLLKFRSKYPDVSYNFSSNELRAAYIGRKTAYLFDLLYSKDKSLIYYVKNPSTKMLLNAIRKHPEIYIARLKNPSESVLLQIVREKPSNIQYIKNPSQKISLEVIKKDPTYIKYIDNPSETLFLEVLKTDPTYIKHIDNPSETLQLEALKRDPEVIIYIKNPTEKVIQFMQ